jgi:hypothetical protein
MTVKSKYQLMKSYSLFDHIATLFIRFCVIAGVLLFALLTFGACSEGNHPVGEPQPIVTPALGEIIGGRWAYQEAGMNLDIYEFQPSPSAFCEAHPVSGWDSLVCNFNYTVIDGAESDTVIVYLQNVPSRVWVIPYFDENEMTVFPEGGMGFPFVLNRI